MLSKTIISQLNLIRYLNTGHIHSALDESTPTKADFLDIADELWKAVNSSIVTLEFDGWDANFYFSPHKFSHDSIDIYDKCTLLGYGMISESPQIGGIDPTHIFSLDDETIFLLASGVVLHYSLEGEESILRKVDGISIERHVLLKYFQSLTSNH